MSKSYFKSNFQGVQINPYPYCIDLPTESLKLCYAVEYLSNLPGQSYWFSRKDVMVRIHFNTSYEMAVLYNDGIQQYIQERMECE